VYCWSLSIKSRGQFVNYQQLTTTRFSGARRSRESAIRGGRGATPHGTTRPHRENYLTSTSTSSHRHNHHHVQPSINPSINHQIPWSMINKLADLCMAYLRHLLFLGDGLYSHIEEDTGPDSGGRYKLHSTASLPVESRTIARGFGNRCIKNEGHCRENCRAGRVQIELLSFDTIA
jgi:hypothetical protein